jgi:CRP-like cAMP-binding protein
MPAPRARNRVLDQLAQSDPDVFARLHRDLEPIALQHGAELGAARQPSDWTYFVESGIVSLIAATRGGHSVGVAIVGREGVAGIADALGKQPLPYRLIVQLPGLAYRAPKPVVREHILSCSALHELLMDQSQRLMHQLAQSAVCNRFHTSVQRLSRWLLLSAERAETTRFELTHEFIAQTVGAPRSAVSEAAARLRRKGTIDYHRGVLTIRNPARLHRLACECFDVLSLASSRAAADATPKPKQAGEPAPAPVRKRRRPMT